MRIIQVINVRWFNATAWYGLFLGQLFAQRGHKVLILCLPKTQTLNKVKQTGLSYKTLELNTNNPLKIVYTYLQLQQIIKEFKPDIINCHRGEAFILFGLLAKKFKYKLIRTRGDQRLPKRNIFNLWLHRKVAKAVIATNSIMFNHFTHALRVPKEKLFLVIGGVDTQKFYASPKERQQTRADLKFNSNHFVVGLLGRFDKVKGQKQLIQAISILYNQKKINHIRLLLIGFSSALSENTIKNWLHQYKISEITTITGKISNPRAFINALDLGIVASLYSETIIRAGLEIMACKIPLIGTKVGVLPDILPQNALVSPNNPKELAQKIEKCLDPNFKINILKSEQETISKLTEQTFYQKTLRIYEQAK
ncbi:glycosyltransferase [Desulfonauticus submarinus]